MNEPKTFYSPIKIFDNFIKYSGKMTYFIQNFRTFGIFLCILGHFWTIL